MEGKIIDMFLFGNKTPNESDILDRKTLSKNKCNYNTSLK